MRRPSIRVLSILVLFVASIGLPVHAKVQPAALFGDGMVLQRGEEVAVWGWADPGEAVTVTLAGKSAKTAAGQDMAWRVTVPPPKAGGPYTLTIEGENTVAVKDVLVGDVWICSGQSNMVWPLHRCDNAAEEIAGADHPNIRLFKVERRISVAPRKNTKGSWRACTPESARHFSGVGYFFGRALRRHLDVPIGLIEADWGGSPSEAWTSALTVRSNEAFAPIVERWAEYIEAYPEAYQQHKRKIEEWNRSDKVVAWRQAAKEAKAKGQRPPRPPRKPRPPRGPNHYHRPSNLYNGLIYPLIPYTMRGVIWYQGESNARRAAQYREIFPLMIEDWRTQWGGEAFPFLFVQLANYRHPKPEPGDDAWAELREAQTMTLKRVPKTGMAVTIDCGEVNTIHPGDKKTVGERLALVARAVAYGEDIVYSGPIYKGMKKEGGRVRLSFDRVGGGLMAGRDGKDDALKGFAIAGADRKFVWAKARIDGDEVVVSSEKVPEPVAVRYAWQINPPCNLYNKEGLPASPFRTDDWPGMTEESLKP